MSTKPLNLGRGERQQKFCPVALCGSITVSWIQKPVWLFGVMLLLTHGMALLKVLFYLTLVAMTKEQLCLTDYPIDSYLGDVATIVGPLIGNYFLQFNIAFECYDATACFLFTSLILILLNYHKSLILNHNENADANH